MTVNSIPQPSQNIVKGMPVDTTWYKWLRELDRLAKAQGVDVAASIEAIARKLGSLDGTIDGIPAQNSAITGLFPINVQDGRVSLSVAPPVVAGELFGIATDQWGRITALRTVVAGAGITIDGTTDPAEIEIRSTATGDVVGPSSATNNAVALFDGTTGKLLKNGVTVATIRRIAQRSFTANTTLTLDDAGGHLFHPSSDTAARTVTIPANSSVPFEIGDAVTFINQNGAGVVTIAITSDTLRLAGAGTTGSRTLAANGIATATKVTATEWIISGIGLS